MNDGSADSPNLQKLMAIWPSVDATFRGKTSTALWCMTKMPGAKEEQMEPSWKSSSKRLPRCSTAPAKRKQTAATQLMRNATTIFGSMRARTATEMRK